VNIIHLLRNKYKYRESRIYDTKADILTENIIRKAKLKGVEDNLSSIKLAESLTLDLKSHEWIISK
jgi:hypothetical protein